MPVIETQLDSQSEEFKANQVWMRGLIEEFRNIEAKVIAKAETAREKFAKANKLLPRERIERILDPGSPYLELMSLAGYMMHDDKDGSGAGGGVIAGIGYISGVRALIVANNSAIKGGTISPAGLHKAAAPTSTMPAKYLSKGPGPSPIRRAFPPQGFPRSPLYTAMQRPAALINPVCRITLSSFVIAARCFLPVHLY
jgi:hypothetical protein